MKSFQYGKESPAGSVETIGDICDDPNIGMELSHLECWLCVVCEMP